MPGIPLRIAPAVRALALASACHHAKQVAKSSALPAVDHLLKREKRCQFPNEISPADTTKYVGVRNAAYAYGYVYPKAFREIIIESDHPMSDTLSMASPDNHASLKIWIGETVSFPLGVINGKLKTSDFARADTAVEKAIRLLKHGHYPYFKGGSIDYMCHGYQGYAHSVCVVGHNAKQVIIYKIDLSELPVSGDLIFKNLVFTYNKGLEKQYHAIGLTMAKDFGDPFSEGQF
jgi:hypothetical protein